MLLCRCTDSSTLQTVDQHSPATNRELIDVPARAQAGYYSDNTLQNSQHPLWSAAQAGGTPNSPIAWFAGMLLTLY